MNRYKVALLGLGPRGKVHAYGFLDHPGRFELSALCDLNEERLSSAASRFHIPNAYGDAERMLSEIRPDVFCFATQPDTRLSLIELAVKHRVKAIAFEKPMATSLHEARAITELCVRNGIKAIVCHQQKYLSSMIRLKEMVEAGDIGQVVKIHASTQPWLSQLGTHFMDYMMWINGGARAEWVTGHAHGLSKLSDSHPSPDYLFGQVQFDNGVRGIIECGYLSLRTMDGDDKFWVDNRLTVYGTHGYAWAETDGRWEAFTRSSGGSPIGGHDDPWAVQHRLIQSPYLEDLADWLDDDAKIHSCNVQTACHGFEILEAMCVSALEHRRVDLPLVGDSTENIYERMRSELV